MTNPYAYLAAVTVANGIFSVPGGSSGVNTDSAMRGAKSQSLKADRLAIVPELAGAEIAVPFDIEPAGSLQYNLLSRGELQFLAGWQHMVEGDVGVERELLRRADIGAHLFDQPVSLLRDSRAEPRSLPRARGLGSSRFVLRRRSRGEQHPDSKRAETREKRYAVHRIAPSLPYYRADP